MPDKLLTPRDIRSRETKDRILNAAVELMAEYGADALTVKNICERASVSNGSFYHFFPKKDDIYIYFLLKNHNQYFAENETRLNEMNIREKIVDVYLMHVKLCESLGARFTAAFYSTGNRSLDPLQRSQIPGSYYMMDKCAEYLREAQREGTIRGDADIAQARLMLGAISIGVLFQWAVAGGEYDPKPQISTLIGCYIDSLVTEKI